MTQGAVEYSTRSHPGIIQPMSTSKGDMSQKANHMQSTRLEGQCVCLVISYFHNCAPHFLRLVDFCNFESSEETHAGNIAWVEMFSIASSPPAL